MAFSPAAQRQETKSGDTYYNSHARLEGAAAGEAAGETYEGIKTKHCVVRTVEILQQGTFDTNNQE